MTLSASIFKILFKSVLLITFSFSLFTVSPAQIFIRENHRLKENLKKEIEELNYHGYETGIGFRGGLEGGITVKHFLKNDNAWEGILSSGWGYGGIRITGLYEISKPVRDFNELKWFYGFGAHLGFYSGSYNGYVVYDKGYYDRNNVNHAMPYQPHYTTVGIDGILGLEYQFVQIPFTLTVDIKPYLDIADRGYHYIDGAFSIRYIF